MANEEETYKEPMRPCPFRRIATSKDACLRQRGWRLSCRKLAEYSARLPQRRLFLFVWDFCVKGSRGRETAADKYDSHIDILHAIHPSYSNNVPVQELCLSVLHRMGLPQCTSNPKVPNCKSEQWGVILASSGLQGQRPTARTVDPKHTKGHSYPWTEGSSLLRL